MTAPTRALRGQSLTGRAPSGNAGTSQALTGQAPRGNARTDQTLTGRAPRGHALTGQTLTGQAPRGNARTDQTLTGRALTGQGLTGQVLAGSAVAGQALIRSGFGLRRAVVAAGAVLLGALVLVLGPGPALAQADVVRIQAVGVASADAADARDRARDAAFADAVQQAVETLVSAQDRRAKRPEIATRVVRRARRFIRSFQTVQESTDGQRLQIRIAAEVDMVRLRAALSEIGLDLGPSSEVGSGPPRAALLVRIERAGHAVENNFGAVPGGGARSSVLDRVSDGILAEGLREYGFELVDVAAAELSDLAADAGDEPRDGLAVTDRVAALVAGATDAIVAVVVGIVLGPEQGIRGTRFLGVAGTAAMRVLDLADGEPSVVASTRIPIGGFANEAGAAQAQAAGRAGARLIERVGAAVVAHWPPRAASADAIAIEIRGYRDWRVADAIRDHLARSSEVERVWPRWIGAGNVVLAVVLPERTGQAAQRRASALLRRLDTTRLSAGGAGADEGAGGPDIDIERASGDGLVVTVRYPRAEQGE